MSSDPHNPPEDSLDDALDGPLFAPSMDDEEPLDWDEPAPRRRGIIMRHPALLLVLLAGAAFLLIKNVPLALQMLETPVEFGVLSDRPMQVAEGNKDLPDLTHNRFGKLTSVVQLPSILATGEKNEAAADPVKANEGRRFYVKLDGAKVFAILDAARPDVLNFRERRRSLVGFEVNATGRMIDPDVVEGFAATASTLRLKYNIPVKTPIRLFDTTYDPADRWPYAVISVIMALTALLALFGLVRVLLARREAA